MATTRTYQFEIKGSAAEGQTWQHSGLVEDIWFDLGSVFEAAMAETFHQLTHGKAVYGQPGVGCFGPYHITNVTLTQIEN